MKAWEPCRDGEEAALDQHGQAGCFGKECCGLWSALGKLLGLSESVSSLVTKGLSKPKFLGKIPCVSGAQNGP